MKTLKQYITEASKGWQLPRADVIALENDRLDYKEYLTQHFNDNCLIWLLKSSGKRSGEWNSITIFVPYPLDYFVEIRLHFDKLPTELIPVIGHWSGDKINVKVPNDLFKKLLDNKDVKYYNSIFADNPKKYTDTYAKYL